MNVLIVDDSLGLEEIFKLSFYCRLMVGRKEGLRLVQGGILGGWGSGGDVGRETGAAIYVSLGYCNA